MCDKGCDASFSPHPGHAAHSPSGWKQMFWPQNWVAWSPVKGENPVRIKPHYQRSFQYVTPTVIISSELDFVPDLPPVLPLGVPRSQFGNLCCTCVAALPPLLTANIWASIIHTLTWLSLTFKYQLLILTAPMRLWGYFSLSQHRFYKFTPCQGAGAGKMAK